ncbi:hypothetical protein CL689_06100 [Candidatus Saccharibacteria bacterium]|nr:hypothetical protein [Candidatus Saccharibacteria bacterium]|tara:strand:- start:1282 stop:1692 length:411 start_codon:yes stop_codon:yes gene_type:complete
MRITNDDLVASQKIDLRKLAVLIAGFTLSGLVATILLIAGAGTWSSFGFLLFLPALSKYKALYDAQKDDLRAFIEKHGTNRQVVRYVGKGTKRTVHEISCPSCLSKNFRKHPVPGNHLLASVHCEQCSRFLYNTTN